MGKVDRCSERRGEDGRFLPASKAYEEGCRCAVCRALHGDDNPADKVERDEETGRFKSTALTRSLKTAVAEAGGPEALYGLVEAGRSASEILTALDMDQKDETAQGAVYRMLNQNPERYEEAKRISADALAERAFELYGEDAPETSADAKWRNDRAGHMRWLAEMRSGFTKDGVQVNVDIGSLYLDALREHGNMNRNPDPSPVEVQEAEYEFEDEPEGVEA